MVVADIDKTPRLASQSTPQEGNCAEDIENIDRLEMILSCYVEYTNLISTGDSGEEYKGSILTVLNEKFEEAIKGE